MHQRQVIRDEVVRRLTNQTPAGPRVTSTQVDPYRASELPALSVYTPSDPLDEDHTNKQELSRNLDLEIVGWVVDIDANPAANQMDDIAEAVEGVMDVDPFLGGAAGRDGLLLQNTETVIVAEMDGRRFDRPRGLIKLTYTVPYITDRVPPTKLDNFQRAGATTQIAGADDNNTISDLVTVESP